MGTLAMSPPLTTTSRTEVVTADNPDLLIAAFCGDLNCSLINCGTSLQTQSPSGQCPQYWRAGGKISASHPWDRDEVILHRPHIRLGRERGSLRMAWPLRMPVVKRRSNVTPHRVVPQVLLIPWVQQAAAPGGEHGSALLSRVSREASAPSGITSPNGLSISKVLYRVPALPESGFTLLVCVTPL